MSVRSVTVNSLCLIVAIAVFGVQWPVYNGSEFAGILLTIAVYMVGMFVIQWVAIALPAILMMIFSLLVVFMINDKELPDNTDSCITVAVYLFAIVAGIALDIWALTGGLNRFFSPFPVFTFWQAAAFAIVSTGILSSMKLGKKKS